MSSSAPEVVKILEDKAAFAKAISCSDEKPVVIVDFFATWCGPCKDIAPKMEELAKEKENKNVGFFKLDIDEVLEVAQEYSIRSVPTFIIFKGGETIGRLSGANFVGLVKLLKPAAATAAAMVAATAAAEAKPAAATAAAEAKPAAAVA